MCGIAGSIATGIELDKQVVSVSKATEAQRHRGPDGSGVVTVHATNPTVVFGHRRLAIIDLSPAGHQPMCDPETNNWITFNGEIYNFLQLRSTLEAKGCLFRTQTDTEVILKAYAVWGEDCVKRLRGIFAFAIWDSRAEQLMLVRDQIGVKPFYYFCAHNQLIFASEVRALLASGVVSRRLNLQGVRSYLAYGSVQDPYSLVQDIHSLLPGHIMVWKQGEIRTAKYWGLPDCNSITERESTSIIEHIKYLLKDAIRIQMIADVPLGAFLSGGIDSTSIVALMQRLVQTRVKTFSIIFDEKSYDERYYARAAADFIGTEHTELLLSGNDVRSTLPDALKAYDQPSFDGLNTYFVSKITREAGLTVALSGVGGDELFGGYGGFQKHLQIERWGTALRKSPLLRHTIANTIKLHDSERARRLVDLLMSNYAPYFSARQVFSTRQVQQLLVPSVYQDSQDWWPSTFVCLEQETSGYDAINSVSAMEVRTYMLNTLLRDTDQMSMAHALEVRVPLLDHKLIEYLFTIPGKFKLDASQPKPLLTRPLNKILPQECVNRSKLGFGFPFEIWLRESLREQVHATILESPYSQSTLFTRVSMHNLWNQFENNQIRWSRVWSIFILLNWLQMHKIHN